MARKKLLIAALVVGTFAAVLMYMYVQEREREVERYVGDEYTVDVAVASMDIPAGTALEQQHVTTESVPQDFLPANPLLREDVDIYLGQPVANNIDADAILLTNDFAVADDRATTLAARVPSGERAMTISVNAISGVAGLLRPGDRVDILGTFAVHDEDELVPEAGAGGQGFVTMSLLQNVTLLAVGDEFAGRDGRGGGYNNVTLSLTPAESEMMVIAQTRGDLTLLLRNREDMEQVPVNRRTLREVLEELDVINRERRERVDEGPPPCPPGERRNIDGECIRDIEIIR